ncbi:MAG: type IV pilus twitching motility protein PilT [Planctomycetaceae bacterium]|nr:type IV pilus twitching motility protein PilT [Planctomycetaceae bacterium]
MPTLPELLEKTLELGASDLHLVPDLPPLFRVSTELAPVGECPPLTAAEVEGFARQMLDEHRWGQFLERRDMDFSTTAPSGARFRVNAHFQRGVVAIAFRAVSSKVPTFQRLNLPEVIENFARLPRGLVLVTGQTGHGKSTTLASMIQLINETSSRHIITLEDPVEYEFRNVKSVIEQRELGSDVPTFASGLRHALRQDPDVILVGEMRDLETTSAAITAAETGHLVLSTMHTQSAAQTVERILDIYPGDQQNQIRAMLANTLQAVVSMALFKRADGPGMAPACEIMVCNAAVRNCIRTNRVHEIANIIQTSASAGMVPLDDAIKGLLYTGKITRAQALAAASKSDRMAAALGLKEVA